MNKSFTFGCGQGATKAMIYCIENGTLDKNECCVVNSTIKDIPEDYRDRCIIISEDPDAGCGKVRAAAKKLMINYLRNNPNVIEELIPDDVQYVNIITTTEGASGSGASVVLAKWIESQIGLPVMITLICGFESDTRGLQNTIEYFKDLEGGNYIVKTVSNKRFLEKTSNTFVAERLANEDIATGIKVVNAFDIVDSEQNIDDTDHYKLITNPGMMFVTEVTFDKKLKNPNQFDQIVSDAIDYSSSLDFEPSATKIGVFMNISDDNLSVIDTSFSAIKKKLCGNNTIEEFFVHRQYVSSEPEFIRIIASGMNLPKEELQDMYAKYQKNLKASTNDDDFFSAISGMETVTQQSTHTKKNTDDDFFSKFDNEETNEETDMVIRRSKRRRPTGSSGTPQATVNSDGYEKKKNVFTAKKTGSSNNSSPYSEDLINGNI
jgi:hypothetical protein